MRGLILKFVKAETSSTSGSFRFINAIQARSQEIQQKTYTDFLLGRGGGVQELHYLWPWQSSPARLFISMHSHYILLCLRPLTYCDLQAFANNTHIQVQCIHSDTKWLILCTTVLARDSRGQFAQLNMPRNVLQLTAVLIRPGISKRHGEHQDLNVKQKGYSKSHFLHSRELQCVKRTVVTKNNLIFLYETMAIIRKAPPG